MTDIYKFQLDNLTGEEMTELKLVYDMLDFLEQNKNKFIYHIKQTVSEMKSVQQNTNTMYW